MAAQRSVQHNQMPTSGTSSGEEGYGVNIRGHAGTNDDTDGQKLVLEKSYADMRSYAERHFGGSPPKNLHREDQLFKPHKAGPQRKAATAFELRFPDPAPTLNRRVLEPASRLKHQSIEDLGQDVDLYPDPRKHGDTASLTGASSVSAQEAEITWSTPSTSGKVDFPSDAESPLTSCYHEYTVPSSDMKPPIWEERRHGRAFKIRFLAGEPWEETFSGAMDMLSGLNPSIWQMPSGSRVINMKAETEENIRRSLQSGIWSSPGPVNTRIRKIWDERPSSKDKIFLLFSITGRLVVILNQTRHKVLIKRSKKYCGVAEMKGPFNPDAISDFWDNGQVMKGSIPLTWIFCKNVPFHLFRSIIHGSTGDNVANMWNGMIFSEELGRLTMQIYAEAPHFDNVLTRWSDWLQDSTRLGSDPRSPSNNRRGYSQISLPATSSFGRSQRGAGNSRSSRNVSPLEHRGHNINSSPYETPSRFEGRFGRPKPSATHVYGPPPAMGNMTPALVHSSSQFATFPTTYPSSAGNWPATGPPYVEHLHYQQPVISFPNIPQGRIVGATQHTYNNTDRDFPHGRRADETRLGFRRSLGTLTAHRAADNRGDLGNHQFAPGPYTGGYGLPSHPSVPSFRNTQTWPNDQYGPSVQGGNTGFAPPHFNVGSNYAGLQFPNPSPGTFAHVESSADTGQHEKNRVEALEAQLKAVTHRLNLVEGFAQVQLGQAASVPTSGQTVGPSTPPPGDRTRPPTTTIRSGAAFSCDAPVFEPAKSTITETSRDIASAGSPTLTQATFDSSTEVTDRGGVSLPDASSN
ncbi:hypothetical protein B0A49_07884 [Cryomyces minteri]|uniref:YTH domain-containing protein n=1 Tax=Cryomyces minteri TaxID=331657 RepID=A0A4U0X2I0_9PEZI|nr:hypothetical protein B0A49_07884 [Cryomyces minteri]